MKFCKYLLLFAALTGSSILYGEEVQDALMVFKDDEVYRALPKPFLFPDVENALFRSGDGKELHLGPGKDGVFFVLTPDDQVKVLTAPSEGKAYLDSSGNFAIWYDTLAEGISFKNGKKIIPANPIQTRFGVSYDATAFYLSQTNTTQVFLSEQPESPLFEIEAFYAYKLVTHENEFHLVGYTYLGHEEMRTHQYKRFLKVDEHYLQMNEFDLPDHLVLLDINPYEKKALFLNDSEMVPQIFQMTLRDQVMKSLGMVQYYGFYLHPSFRNIMPQAYIPSDKP